MEAFLAWPIKLKKKYNFYDNCVVRVIFANFIPVESIPHINLTGDLIDNLESMLKNEFEIGHHCLDLSITPETWWEYSVTDKGEIPEFVGLPEALNYTFDAVSDITRSPDCFRPCVYGMPSRTRADIMNGGIAPFQMIESVGPLTLYVKRNNGSPKEVCVFHTKKS